MTLAYVHILPLCGLLTPYLHVWLIGAAYATPFGLGIIVGWGSGRAEQRTSGLTLSVAVCIIAAALAYCSIVQPGPWVAVALGTMTVALAGVRRDRTTLPTPLRRAALWLGAFSFVFYLAHSPWTKPIVRILSAGGVDSAIVMFMATLASAFLVSLLFWWSYGATRRAVLRRQNPRTTDG